MKDKKVFYCILAVVIIILSRGCVYLYEENAKPKFKVSIGVPKDEKNVDFGVEIDDQKEANDILLTLIHAEQIEKPSITKKLPNAEIIIDDTEVGVNYISSKVWIEGEHIIVSLNKEKNKHYPYKKISGTSAEKLINYIEKCK